MRKWCIVELLTGKEENYMLTDLGELFSYSEIEGEKKFLSIVGEGVWRSYITMAEYENKLIFPPYFADSIAVYDLEKQEFEYISLPAEKVPRGQRLGQYKKIACFKEKAYFVGDNISALICMDLKTYEIKRCSEWQKEFEKKYGVFTQSNIYSDLCVTGHSFWVPLKEKNYVMEYNMLDDTHSFYRIGERENQYSCICFDGNCFWLSGDEKFITKWDKESGTFELFEDFPSDFAVNTDNGGRKAYFSCSILWNHSIYFAPMSANMCIRIDLESGEMSSLVKRERKNMCLIMKKIGDSSALYLEEIDGETIKFSKGCRIEKDNSCKEAVISFTEKEKQKLLKKKIEMQILIQEKGCLDLQLLANSLLPEEKKDQVLHKKALAGNEIYRMTANGKK